MVRSSTSLKQLPAPPALRCGQALFLDFDGTLVDIAAAPDLVRVRAELPDLLGALSDFLAGALAMVSGRPCDELARLLAPFAGALAGQHGLECRLNGAVTRCPIPPGLGQIRSALADFATRHGGVLLEEKGRTLVLHYRQKPSLAATCRGVVRRAALATGGTFKAVEGKMSIELMPRTAGKGQAIAAFLAKPPFHGRVPVFVGDDRGDEDGFAMVDQLGGISVRVGAGATAARHQLADVADVLTWLARSVAR